MKRIYLYICIVVLGISSLAAQNSGTGFLYRAVVRTGEGKIIPETPLTLRVSLLPGIYATTPSWVETHSLTTNEFGVVSLTVGKGIRVASSQYSQFSEINFSAIRYWLRVEWLDNKGKTVVIEEAELGSAPVAETVHRNKLPVGVVVAFPASGAAVPAGWLYCDGRLVNQTDYPELYAVIGDTYGNSGNQFRLPDYRGLYHRGFDSGTGRDPDGQSRSVGSVQSFAQQNLTGTLFTGNQQIFMRPETTGGFYTAGAPNGSNFKTTGSIGLQGIRLNISDQKELEAESRPETMTIHYIIKY